MQTDIEVAENVIIETGQLAAECGRHRSLSSISMTSSHEDHWVEIIDDEEQAIVRTLGPYAGFRLAEMAHRGLMRQLNVKRYSAVVVSSREATATSMSRHA